MRLARWSAAVFPLLIGLSADLVLAFFLRFRPVVVAKVDLGTLALLFGILLTMILLVTVAYTNHLDDKHEKEIDSIHFKANDERRRFLRRLDHELKNPLTAIRAGLTNITETTSPELRQEALSSVEAQTLRLSRLAGDLRKLAELESRPIERVDVDLANMLTEVYHLAEDRPVEGERRLALTLPHAPWPLPKIKGDQDLLFLAVHNLLDNALKFTRSGDTVEVRAFEDGANVVVEVADTGPGIPADELPHVWEELYRGQGARGVPGSGLGLALVRAIAERHNGSVSLRSRAGQGTVFTLRLPAG